MNGQGQEKTKPIETAERAAGIEFELASDIRRNMLPAPLADRTDVAVTAAVYSDSDIGGDFYDTFFTDDSHLVFMAADVAGKGFATTLFMMEVQMVLRGFAEQKLSPGEVLMRANKKLAANNRFGLFAAVWLGVLNTRNGLLTYCDAGHVPPLLKRKDGTFETLRTRKNPVLAAIETASYKNGELQLEPGDRLFLTSSGAFSIVNGRGETFSREALLSAMNEEPAKDGETLRDRFAAAYRTFLGDTVTRDDYTFFLLDFLEFHDIRFYSEIKGPEAFDSFGGVSFETTADDVFRAGIHYADIVNVRIGSDIRCDMPVVPDFRYLRPGETGLVAWPGKGRKCSACTFIGNFVAEQGVRCADFPQEVRVKLVRRNGFAEEYSARDLTRSNERAAYPYLTDEGFANFREVTAGTILPGRLFRGSSPIDPRIGRNAYCDAALRDHAVKTCINLDNSEEAARKKDGYGGSYYSTCHTIFLPIETDYTSEKTKKSFQTLFREMAASEPPYFVHCIEGQDRTGIVIAILEALAGATLREMVDDYMMTFYNYYGVERGTARYNALFSNIGNMLSDVLETASVDDRNAAELAERYLERIGISASERRTIYENLTK